MNSIEIKNLTYSYPGASAPTLKDINLEIEKGDFLAIVGNNGCGKSTLCKAMNGLIPHFITGDFQGEVMAGGISTLEADIGTLAQKVGYVYQDFENQIVRPTVLDDASYACMNYGMKDYKERGLEALDGALLPERPSGRRVRSPNLRWMYRGRRPVCRVIGGEGTIPVLKQLRRTERACRTARGNSALASRAPHGPGARERRPRHRLHLRAHSW